MTNEFFLLKNLLQIRKFENLETDEERIKAAKDVYDQYIMKELLSQSHVNTTSVSIYCLQFMNTTCPVYVAGSICNLDSVYSIDLVVHM